MVSIILTFSYLKKMRDTKAIRFCIVMILTLFVFKSFRGFELGDFWLAKLSIKYSNQSLYKYTIV